MSNEICYLQQDNSIAEVHIKVVYIRVNANTVHPVTESCEQIYDKFLLLINKLLIKFQQRNHKHDSSLET